ncbi:oocyte-secreted protein 4A [Ochotona princeps]|uniref:oocyte-secreted protein 4A n=1 Tax=Ochotona princeps TaxID=9978 RepID=UPI00271469C4|nr:oocyte-secreted protein 4A [Ochotona princeps]
MGKKGLNAAAFGNEGSYCGSGFSQTVRVCLLGGDMSVSCTIAWIHVLIGRTPIIDNVPFHAGELYLGYGCPVNVVESNFLGFLYLLSFCGIRVQEYPLGIVIETSVTYEPTFADFIIRIPVSCYSQSKFPMAVMMRMRDNTGRECRRSVGQSLLSCKPEVLGFSLDSLIMSS